MSRSFGLPLIVIVSVALATGVEAAAQRGRPNPSTVVKNAMDRALNDPTFDANGGSDSSQLANDLRDLGMSDADISDVLKHLGDAKKDGDAQRGKDGGDQNGSGSADWYLGSVTPGNTYRSKVPLTNNCRVGATVTIQYPSTIPLTGPETVQIPPKSKVDVEMSLSFNRDDPPPQGNWQNGPLSDKGFVPELTMFDQITMTHPQQPGGTKTTPEGTYTYVCHKMQRTYKLELILLWYLATSDINQGGGGGKPKPPMSKPCQQLWDDKPFKGDAIHQTAQSCKGEFAAQTHHEFLNEIAPKLRRNPAPWKFLEGRTDPNTMSADQLLSLHREIVSSGLLGVAR